MNYIMQFSSFGKKAIVFSVLMAITINYSFSNNTNQPYKLTEQKENIKFSQQDSVKSTIELKEFVKRLNEIKILKLNDKSYHLNNLKNHYLIITSFSYSENKKGNKSLIAKGEFWSEKTTPKGRFALHVNKNGIAKIVEKQVRMAQMENLKFNSHSIKNERKNINARQTPNENNSITSSLRYKKANPLVFINGKRSSFEKLNNLNKNDIEKVNILKNKKAIKKYGKKAKDGVILVTTK